MYIVRGEKERKYEKKNENSFKLNEETIFQPCIFQVTKKIIF